MFLIAMIGMSLSVFAANVDVEFKTLYDSKKYSEALESLKKHPDDTGVYFYNLGNVYYRLGKTGTAVAQYQKANRMLPHDPDIQYNLRLSQDQLKAQLAVKDLDPSSTWLEQLADRTPVHEVRAVLGLIFFVIMMVLTRTYLKTRNLKKTFSHPAGISCSIALAMTLSLFVTEKVASRCPPAILVEAEVIRSGPGDQYLELTRFDAGMKIRLLEIDSNESGEVWKQVRFSVDSIGWVRASNLVVL